MADTPDPVDNGSPDPDWGLGATADPVALGAAMAALGKKLASDPGLVAVGCWCGWALPLVLLKRRARKRLDEIDYALPGMIDLLVVAARAVGSATEGPIEADPRDARFADPAWDSNAGFYGLRQCYLLWGRTMKELAAAT